MSVCGWWANLHPSDQRSRRLQPLAKTCHARAVHLGQVWVQHWDRPDSVQRRQLPTKGLPARSQPVEALLQAGRA